MPLIDSFSVEDQMAIHGKMEEYLKKSESSFTALVDRGGNLFAQCGETQKLDISILAALAAGSFAATGELAKRLGEKEFSALFHEGEGACILMSALKYDCLLLTVFQSTTNIGLVRFYTQQLSPTLNQHLDLARERSSKHGGLMIEVDLSDPNKKIVS